MKKKVVTILLAIAVGLISAGCSKEQTEISETMESVVETSVETQATTVAVEVTEATSLGEDYSSYPLNTTDDCWAVLNAYATDHGFDALSYPTTLINVLFSNHDTLDFVLHYPELSGTQDDPSYPGTIDVSSEYSPLRVPYYYQFDSRWGYKMYAGSDMGFTGCGPTCLAMVATYLTGNTDFNPAWMAAYSENNGYAMDGGTSWNLMATGAGGLGIDVVAITADQDRVDRNLAVGNVIVCLMGPGDFTNGSAQFIIICNKTENGYEIRDPGSITRTNQEWQFETLAAQMTGCWVMRIL